MTSTLSAKDRDLLKQLNHKLDIIIQYLHIEDHTINRRSSTEQHEEHDQQVQPTPKKRGRKPGPKKSLEITAAPKQAPKKKGPGRKKRKIEEEEEEEEEEENEVEKEKSKQIEEDDQVEEEEEEGDDDESTKADVEKPKDSEEAKMEVDKAETKVETELISASVDSTVDDKTLDVIPKKQKGAAVLKSPSAVPIERKLKDKSTTEEETVSIEKLKELVGCRLKVYWPNDKAWYKGVVAKFHPGSRKHIIKYDDGDEETLYLPNEKYKILDESEK